MVHLCVMCIDRITRQNRFSSRVRTNENKNPILIYLEIKTEEKEQNSVDTHSIAHKYRIHYSKHVLHRFAKAETNRAEAFLVRHIFELSFYLSFILYIFLLFLFLFFFFLCFCCFSFDKCIYIGISDCMSVDEFRRHIHRKTKIR